MQVNVVLLTVLVAFALSALGADLLLECSHVLTFGLDEQAHLGRFGGLVQRCTARGRGHGALGGDLASAAVRDNLQKASRRRIRQYIRLRILQEYAKWGP